ncbi:hypothetical protein BJX99DRAFT_130609 [Aspergillus californicus]
MGWGLDVIAMQVMGSCSTMMYSLLTLVHFGIERQNKWHRHPITVSAGKSCQARPSR